MHFINRSKIKCYFVHQDDDEGHGGGGRGRHRKRHRRLFKSIGKQMDFYFGDANMSKSKFLSQEIAAKGPWLNLETFLKFNKLAEILRQGFEGRLETNDLWAALSNATSDLWEIREIEVDQNESRYVQVVSNKRW